MCAAYLMALKGGFFDADDSTNINMDIFDEDGQAEGSNDEEYGLSVITIGKD
jgi:hypothetical protein